MRRELIRKRLIEVRDANYSEIPEFRRASNLHDANVRMVNEGSVPTVENMEKWVTACGYPSLSQFIAEIEKIERGDQAPEEHPLIMAARVLVSRNPEAALKAVEFLKGWGPPPKPAPQRKRR